MNRTLPAEGESWSASKRDRFVAAFRSLLDLCYAIEEEEAVVPLAE